MNYRTKLILRWIWQRMAYIIVLLMLITAVVFIIKGLPES